MNMMDGPKFRRKHTSATRPRGRAVGSPDPAPQVDEAAEKALQENEDRLRRQVEARLKAEAEQEAHLAAEAEAKQQAEADADAKARRKAEFEELAHAEAMRRVMQARERRQAQERAEREAAEISQREAQERAEREAAEKAQREAQERSEREAAERAKREAQERAEREAAERERADRETAREQARLAAERRAREALAAAERKKAAELARLAEERRLEEEKAAEETRRAAEKARHEKERRQAEAKAAEDARLAAEAAGQAAEEQRRRDAERRAEQHRLSEDRRRAEDDAKNAALRAEAARRAESEAEPLALTEMLPVTKPAAPAVAPAPADLGKIDVNSAWNGLADLTVSAAHLDRNRIITASRDDPAHAAFDVLRTRLLQTLKDNGWRRVAITSPGQGCGKTFTVANLAISLSRQENCRTLVMDLDLRRPRLHEVLGIKQPGQLGDVLRGIVSPEDHLRRMGQNPVNAGRNIAFGLNDRVEKYPSELLQDPRTAAALESIEAKFAPDVMLFDLPPALFCDDVIAFRPQFDGVLLVVGGGLTTEREIKEVERRLGDKTPLLGMILNKAEGSELQRYGY